MGQFSEHQQICVQACVRDFAALADRWDGLPDSVKAQILTLIEGGTPPG